MKSRPLWRIAVQTSLAAEEAVAALLEKIFGERAASYTEAESGATTVAVFPTDGLGSGAGKRAALAAGLQGMRDRGLDPGPARITARKVPREDWAESWKKHFQPIEIGRALLIKPGWSKLRPRHGQALVVIDPGLSFGTGQHPTTGFCLRQIVCNRTPGRAQSFLDIGCGSGILALAASKLGYEPVVAFDFDPQAVGIAHENARRNHAPVSVFQRDLTRMSRQSAVKFDLVCANLTDDLLLSQRERILSLLRADGRLVLSGILTSQFAAVQKAYERAGLRLAASKTAREWQSGIFLPREAR